MAFMFTLFGCTTSVAEYNKISAAKAKEMMDEGNVTVVDVREANEYADGHIEGALLLPVGSIDSKAAEVLPDKDAVILLYCRSGNRSKQAANKLLKLGYTSVYDFGGINGWTYGLVS